MAAQGLSKEEKDFFDALASQFAKAKTNAARVMLPVFKKWWFLGAALGTDSKKTEANLTIDQILLHFPSLAVFWDEIDQAGDEYIRVYFDEWWGQLTKTTRDRLRSAIQIARDQGLTSTDVMKLISPQFGPARAEMVAVTEMTRLMGGGAVATYRAMQLEEWEWLTARDERVCEICEELDGKRFPISTPFDPAHVRCRCRSRPVPLTGLR